MDEVSETSTIPRGYSQCITCGFMFPSGNVHHCPTLPIPNPRLAVV